MDAISGGDPLRLGPGEIDAGLALSDAAGWNQAADDWRLFVERSTLFAARDGRGGVVGTAACLPYMALSTDEPGRAPQQTLCWIGLVLVADAWRRRGIATRLITQCLEAASAGQAHCALDATQAGAAVYRGMGFSPVGGLTRWRREEQASRSEPAAIAASDGVSRLVDADRRGFGVDRSPLLRDVANRPGSRVHASGSAVALVRNGRRFRHIGPVISASDHDAATVLTAILRSEDGPLLIDLCDGRDAIAAVLTENGFAAERPFVRMSTGANRHGDRGSYVASLGPEFG